MGIIQLTIDTAMLGLSAVIPQRSIARWDNVVDCNTWRSIGVWLESRIKSTGCLARVIERTLGYSMVELSEIESDSVSRNGKDESGCELKDIGTTNLNLFGRIRRLVL